jgi:hypothetical protein
MSMDLVYGDTGFVEFIDNHKRSVVSPQKVTRSNSMAQERKGDHTCPENDDDHQIHAPDDHEDIKRLGTIRHDEQHADEHTYCH